MTDYIQLGSAPALEEPAQLGMPGYAAAARKECQAYIQAIRAKLGPEPQGAKLAVKPFPHEFGSFYEAVCYYDPASPASFDYAMRCERHAPETWEEAGMTPPLKQGREAQGR